MAYLIEYDNDVETYTPAPCAAPCSCNFVPDADRRPLRRIQCQFSAGDPCQANLLPCRALRAAKLACRAGGCAQHNKLAARCFRRDALEQPHIRR